MLEKNLVFGALAFLAACWSGGFAAADTTFAPPVAGVENFAVITIDGKESISRSEFERRFSEYSNRFGGRFAKLPAGEQQSIRSGFLETLIDEILVARAAASEPIEDEAVAKAMGVAAARFSSKESFLSNLQRTGTDEKTYREGLVQELKRDQWLKKNLTKPKEATKEELVAFYEKNVSTFNPPGEVRTSHILWLLSPEATEAEVEEKRKAAVAAAAHGAKEPDFDAVIKKYKAPRVIGGDLGLLRPYQMQPAYAEAVKELGVGETSQPVRTTFGWHVIRVTEKKEPKKRAFEDIRLTIEKAYKKHQEEEGYRKLLATLRDGVRIETNLP